MVDIPALADSRRVGTTRRGRSSVSVLVPTYQGAAHLGDCLNSLAEQTLSATAFEVVLVLNGPPGASRGVIERFREDHPALQIRLLETREPGAGSARNLALRAADGEYVTFLDDDDQVTPGYLSAMVAAAEPDVVVATMIGDVSPDGTVDLDTKLANRLGSSAGLTVPAHQLPIAFHYNAAKLVSVDIARAASYDTSLRSGEDVVYWLEAFSRRQFQIRVLPPEDEATYLRTVRVGSVGRQRASYDFNVHQRLACLAAIEAVDRSEPSVARVARSLMKGQGWWVNRYLREHPEERGRVAEDVDARGLKEFPWPDANEGLARDLAICYCFPPDLDTSAMVAAKRLRERGLLTDVISQDLSRLRRVDQGSRRIAREITARTRVLRGVPSFSTWEAMRDFAEDAFRAVEEWEGLQGPYRSVYSRAMAVNSHYAAALVKARRPEIEWIAEFSDPLRVDSEGNERPAEVADDPVSTELRTAMVAAGFDPGGLLRVFDWAERLAYALADRVVFTNELQREMMLDYLDDPRLEARVRSIGEVLPHPTLPPRFYELGSGDLDRGRAALHLGYFGVFYSTRDLGDLVNALEKLRPSERERVRLHVFTSHPDRLNVQAARIGLAGVVRARPRLPFLDFLSTARELDVLVVDDAQTARHHDRNPYLPSKVADYVGSGTPVWAISEPGSALSSLRFEHHTRLGDVDGAVALLRRLVRAHDGAEVTPSA